MNLTDPMKRVIIWMQNADEDIGPDYDEEQLKLIFRSLEKRGLVTKVRTHKSHGQIFALTEQGWDWQDSAMDIYNPTRDDSEDVIVWSRDRDGNGMIPAPCCGCTCTMCHSNNCCKVN